MKLYSQMFADYIRQQLAQHRRDWLQIWDPECGQPWFSFMFHSLDYMFKDGLSILGEIC